jgi:hypothetical protein
MLLVLPWSLLHVEDLWRSLLEWPRRGFVRIVVVILVAN